MLSECGTHYKVLYLDPPWSYYGDSDKDQACGKHYNTMPFEELVELPVKERMAHPAVGLMWVTSPKLEMGMDLIKAWDLYYRGIAYVWVKTSKKDGHVIEGQGVRPSIVKPTTELVLAFSTQKKGRPLPLLDEGQGQVVYGPRGQHSEKPDEVRIRIEELFGDVPKLELFARARYKGWDSWGLEADGPMPAAQAMSPRLRERLLKMEEDKVVREIVANLENLPQE